MTDVVETTAAPAAATATETLLTAAPAATEAGKFGDWRDEVPEKFIKDGEVSHADLVKSYKHLESKLRAGDAPPESADKYEYKAPEGVELNDEQKASIDQVKARALELGMTQKQFDAYVSDLSEAAQETAPNPERAAAVLKEDWGKDYDANLALAQKAFSRYGTGVDIAEVGNNPAALKLLSAIGRELREDASPAHGNVVVESMAQLRADPDYTNPHSPRYAILQNKVLELTRQQLATR